MRWFFSRKNREDNGRAQKTEKKDCNPNLSIPQQSTYRCSYCREILPDKHGDYLCSNCRKIEERFATEYYGGYKNRLVEFLSKMGIDVNTYFTTEYTTTDGRPKNQVKVLDELDAIPLRKNEWARYSFICRGSVYCFPQNGIGIRYIKISSLPDEYIWAKSVALSGGIIAMCSDGKNIYYVDEKGIIKSTDRNWIEISLFDSVQECINIISSISDESIYEEIKSRKAVSPDGSENIIEISGYRYGRYPYTYYDFSQKMFFIMSITMDHCGDEVGYYRVEKGKVMERLSKEEPYTMWKKVKEGKVPSVAVVNYLPEADEKDSFEPPAPFGRGVIWN